MNNNKRKFSIKEFFAISQFHKFFQQRIFLAVFLAVLLLISFTVLPWKTTEKEPLNSWQKAVDTIIIILFFAWVVVIAIDHFKGQWEKSLAALLFVFFLCFDFWRFGNADWALVKSQYFDFEAFRPYWIVLLRAFLVTLKIAGGCIVIVPIGGLIFGTLRSLGNPVLDTIINILVTIFRSLPDIVLVTLVYFALPYIGIELDSVPAVIVGLSLMYIAYATEIFRSGIQSIKKIQYEAASALGMNLMQTLSLVILPQAIRVVIPPMTNLMIGILKSTAIACAASAPEMMTRARLLNNQLISVTPLVASAIIYFVVIFPLVLLSMKMEKVAAKYKR